MGVAGVAGVQGVVKGSGGSGGHLKWIITPRHEQLRQRLSYKAKRERDKVKRDKERIR